MHALILAAGKGTRLRPYTEKLAKPAMPFLNLPLLSYPLFHLEQSGLTSLTVNTHHLPKTIEEAGGRVANEDQYRLTYSHEKPEILGSGGAVVFAKNSLSGEGLFVYSNGDEIMLFQHDLALKPLLDAHQETGALATMMLCPHPEVCKKFNGVWIDSEKKVIRLGKEDLGDQLRPLHFTGVMVISERVFDYLPMQGPCNILHDGLLVGMAQGEKVYAHVEEDLLWFETGDKQSYLEAHKQCLEMLAQQKPGYKNLQKILQRFSPEIRFDQNIIQGRASECKAPVNKSLLCMGQRVQMESEVELAGFNVIGNDAHIGNGVSLENTIVGDQVPPIINISLKNEIVL